MSDIALTHIHCATCGADLHHFIRHDDLPKTMKGVAWGELAGEVSCLAQIITGTVPATAKCMMKEYGPADAGEFA